jgi:hypothetical protein
MRKVKILVATLAMTLLVASPAFAQAFIIDVGFMQDTTLDGSGFHLTVGSPVNR